MYSVPQCYAHASVCCGKAVTMQILIDNVLVCSLVNCYYVPILCIKINVPYYVLLVCCTNKGFLQEREEKSIIYKRIASEASQRQQWWCFDAGAPYSSC